MLSYKEFKIENKRDDQNKNNITHFFSRYFVNIFAYPLYLVGLTPNQVTIIFILTGLIGGFLSFNGYLLIAYIFWRLHIIIDMADGSVARVTKLFSEYGDILDKVGHHIIYPIYWIGFIYSSGLLNIYPLLSIIFFATASSQWTLKHLFKNKELRPQAGNIFKRIIANIFGIEGFLIIIILYTQFNLFEGIHVILFLITTNSILLIHKISSLLLNHV